MIDMDKLRAELTRDEGKRHRIYVDTVGKVSGGIGRNLTDVGFSDDEINLMFSNDIARAILDLNRELPWWTMLNSVRQRVLVNLCFNMGIGNREHGLLSFKNTLEHMRAGHYASAAAGMRNSLWYKQVGARGERLAHMMELGE